jgi:hypothetical protein
MLAAITEFELNLLIFYIILPAAQNREKDKHKIKRK